MRPARDARRADLLARFVEGRPERRIAADAAIECGLPVRPTPASDARPPSRGLLFAILGLALALRLIFALRRGLILDEFHSLWHASAPSARAFFEGLVLDNRTLHNTSGLHTRMSRDEEHKGRRAFRRATN